MVQVALSHFCLYCDTECLLEPIDISVEDLFWGAARKLSKHTPIAASAYLDVSEEMLQGMLKINAPGREFFIQNKLVTFRGRDCMAQLMEHVYKVAAAIKTSNDHVSAQMKVTPYWRERRATEPNCWLCSGQLLREEDDEDPIVLHHDHCTGEILGVCHQTCNL